MFVIWKDENLFYETETDQLRGFLPDPEFKL